MSLLCESGSGMQLDHSFSIRLWISLEFTGEKCMSSSSLASETQYQDVMYVRCKPIGAWGRRQEGGKGGDGFEHSSLEDLAFSLVLLLLKPTICARAISKQYDTT